MSEFSKEFLKKDSRPEEQKARDAVMESKAVDKMKGENIFIPTIYFWFEEYNGMKTVMTCAFNWKGLVFGESLPVETDEAENKKHAIMLKNKIKESLDALVHHGKSILDGGNNIDPRLANDQEAIRMKYDPLWRERIVAVRKVMIVKEISEEKAKKLKLL